MKGNFYALSVVSRIYLYFVMPVGRYYLISEYRGIEDFGRYRNLVKGTRG